MTMNTQQAAGGFSLVEVLCAILILGIGIAGLTQGLATALNSSKEVERQTAAALLAAARMETLRAEGYLVEGVEEGDGEGPYALYQWEQTVSATAVDGLYDVTVLVRHARSGQLIYELQTMLFDPPYVSSEPAQPSSRNTRSRNRRRTW